MMATIPKLFESSFSSKVVRTFEAEMGFSVTYLVHILGCIQANR